MKPVSYMVSISFILLLLLLLSGCTGDQTVIIAKKEIDLNAGTLVGYPGAVPYWNTDTNKLTMETDLNYDKTTNKLYSSYFVGNGSLLTNLPVPPATIDTNWQTSGSIDYNTEIILKPIWGSTSRIDSKGQNNFAGLTVGNKGAITLQGTGLRYIYNTAPWSKHLYCVYGDCNFTKDLNIGDYILLSTCGTVADHMEKVATIISDNNLTTENNLFGSGCGNDYTNLTARVQKYPTLRVVDYAGNEKFAIAPNTGVPLLRNVSILLSNGYGINASGNTFINALGGALSLYGNSIQQINLSSGGTVAFLNNTTYWGSDGAGGAVGGTKTEGVIRGSINGGSSNGGGTPLNFQVSALGNNTAMYQKWTIGEPRESGTGTQTQIQRMKLTYNLLDVNVNTHLDYNLSVLKSVAIGTNTLIGLGIGDINATTIYYNTLTAKSPMFLCSQIGKQKECMVVQPELQKTSWVTLDENYGIVGDKSKFDKAITDKSAKMVVEKYVADKISKTPPFSTYDSVTDTYVFNPQLACEAIDYQYWLNGVCKTNEQRKCLTETTKEWDYNKGQCVYSPQKDCEKDGISEWVNNLCTTNSKLQIQRNADLCLQDKTKIWNGTSCVNAN